MNRFVAAVILSLLLGCNTVPHKTDILVRFPVGGELVWVIEDGKRVPYYIVDEDELKKYFEIVKKEKE